MYHHKFTKKKWLIYNNMKKGIWILLLLLFDIIIKFVIAIP